MKRFYFSQEEKNIHIKFIVCGFLYCIIMDCIYWCEFNSFLNWTNYCSEIYSKHKKENRENDQALEVEMKEHIDKNKSQIYKYKLQDVNFPYYEEIIYEKEDYEKIIEVEIIEELYEKVIEVENIGESYEKVIEVSNIGESHEKVVEEENIEKSQKEHIQINQLGCEVDIPIDKIVAFIHNIT
ncbi:hypothetical protein [Clostridium tetani]|uniref:hypothetical protein n=2 Tax=Clostridium tetani TaxID=1513 RepID=UPI00131B0348|nr:hypothetical protein [Clostridium tetani]